MSLTSDDKPYVVKNFSEVGVVLANHERRIQRIEETTDVVHKVWRFLKYLTPAMIGVLAANASPDSLLGKVLAAVLDLLKTGYSPT